MVLKSVHTTPMLNSTSLSKSSWPWFLSTYFCFCIWSIYRSPCKSVLWNKGTPKANGGKTRSKPNLQGACFTEMQIHICLVKGPVFSIQKGESCCMNLCTLRCWHSFKMSFFAAFGSGPVPEYLVSYRMTKDHVTFHSMMYPRKGNLCSYLVQFCAHGRKCYGRVVCCVLF